MHACKDHTVKLQIYQIPDCNCLVLEPDVPFFEKEAFGLRIKLLVPTIISMFVFSPARF